MVVGITQGLERDERVEHGGENGCQTVAALEAFQHPVLALLKRALPEGVNAQVGELLGEFVQPIQPEEEIAQRDAFRVGRQREVALGQAGGIQLVQVDPVLGAGAWV